MLVVAAPPARDRVVGPRTAASAPAGDDRLGAGDGDARPPATTPRTAPEAQHPAAAAHGPPAPASARGDLSTVATTSADRDGDERTGFDSYGAVDTSAET